MSADKSIFICNEQLRAEISCLGAELISLGGADGREYIWQREESVWGRSAPLLFPVIGRLRDGRYTHRGREYRMGRHGFARDSVFTPTQVHGARATFCLTDTAESRELYPFAFKLSLSYELEGRTLIKRVLVENRSEETLIYELGGHDGFLLPEDMTQCRLDFSGLERLSLLRGGGEMELEGGMLPLDTELFRDGALLMRMPKNGVTLRCGEDYRIGVYGSELGYLALWTPYPAGKRLLCIEPWSCVPDSESSPTELSEKPDILSLHPGELRSHSYVISLEEICSEKF